MKDLNQEESVLAIEMANIFGIRKNKKQTPESVKVKRGVTIGDIISYLAKYNLNT
jgi:hypothetical protein